MASGNQAENTEVDIEFVMGYDDNRFDTKVNDEFHCLICCNVLKEPVMCRNEHYFCRDCITKHLHQNCQTCPTCVDELTADTLREVPRIVKNVLDGLMIRCDHHNRGCRERVQLQHLKQHADKCDFQPVICGNEGCDERINERDRIYHENEVCEFRRSKCNNCESTNVAIEGVRRKIKNIETNMLATNTRTANVGAKIENMATEFAEMTTKIANLETKTVATATSAHNFGGGLKKLEKITAATDATLADVKENSGNLKERMKNADTKTADMAKDLAEIKGKVQNMETSTKNINKNLAEIGTKIKNIENKREKTNKKITILIVLVILQFCFLIHMMRKFSNVNLQAVTLLVSPFTLLLFWLSL